MIPLAVHPVVSYAGKGWDGQEGSPVIGTLSAVAGEGSSVRLEKLGALHCALWDLPEFSLETRI